MNTKTNYGSVDLVPLISTTIDVPRPVSSIIITYGQPRVRTAEDRVWRQRPATWLVVVSMTTLICCSPLWTIVAIVQHARGKTELSILFIPSYISITVHVIAIVCWQICGKMFQNTEYRDVQEYDQWREELRLYDAEIYEGQHWCERFDNGPLILNTTYAVILTNMSMFLLTVGFLWLIHT